MVYVKETIRSDNNLRSSLRNPGCIDDNVGHKNPVGLLRRKNIDT